MNSELPIGVFDSGMGGLTVLRALKKSMPNESFIYLGDTARLPYGTKSQHTITQYAVQMASTLVERGIKLLVIACNTATTAALNYLQQLFPHIPVIGVVEPGAQAAVNATRTNHIAVLATEATIASAGYQNAINTLNPAIKILTQSCGLFVSLAEEGWVDNHIAKATAEEYLTNIIQDFECDCVVLGCTHFPVFKDMLTTILGNRIKLVNSAEETAKAVQKVNSPTKQINSTTKFLVTDLSERFSKIGKIFFGEAIPPQQISLIDTQLSTLIDPLKNHHEPVL
jgi:glutamate racemase